MDSRIRSRKISEVYLDLLLSNPLQQGLLAHRSILFPPIIFYHYHNYRSAHRPTKEQKNTKKHTTARIRWWSPTQLLIRRSAAYVWQSGRDAQFSTVYGRMCWN